MRSCWKGKLDTRPQVCILDDEGDSKRGAKTREQKGGEKERQPREFSLILPPSPVRLTDQADSISPSEPAKPCPPCSVRRETPDRVPLRIFVHASLAVAERRLEGQDEQPQAGTLGRCLELLSCLKHLADREDSDSRRSQDMTLRVSRKRRVRDTKTWRHIQMSGSSWRTNRCGVITMTTMLSAHG